MFIGAKILLVYVCIYLSPHDEFIPCRICIVRIYINAAFDFCHLLFPNNIDHKEKKRRINNINEYGLQYGIWARTR